MWKRLTSHAFPNEDHPARRESEFGAVPVNTIRSDGLLTVSNDGSDALHVSGIVGPCAGSFSVLGTTTFAVGSRQTVNLGIKFAPTSVMSCTGNVTVSSDATQGTNVIGIVASAE